MEGFDALLKLAERLISNDFSENMWRTGYADFDSHETEVANIAKFGDDALQIIRRLVDDDHLPKIVIEGIEKFRANSSTCMRKLLCLIGAFMKISLKTVTKHTLPIVLVSDGLYLRLAPLSKQLGVGFSVFQKHLYLSLVENLKTINSMLSSQPASVSKFFVNTLRCFPNFINETGMEDIECIKATADLLGRVAFSDTSDLPSFAAENSVGILTLTETDISDLGIGCVALYSVSEMTRRYVNSEEQAAAIFVAFFPLLVCVDETAKRGAGLSPISAQTARQSDLLADFLAHLCSDIHVDIKIANFIQQIIDRAPEKADYRTRAVAVASRLSRCLTAKPGELHGLISWAISYGKSSRAGSRVIAIDFLHSLRTMNLEEALLNKIIRHLLSRTQDSSSNVRIRALALLSDCLTSLGQSKSATSIGSSDHLNEMETESRSSDEVNEGVPVPKIELEIAVLTTAIRLADDARVLVRRSALNLLEAVLPLIAPVCNFAAKTGPGSDVAVVFRRGFETCAQRCVDCSVLVRFQAARATTEVLQKAISYIPTRLIASEDMSWLGRIWISSVLPLVLDSEQRVQEKAVEYVIQLAIPRAKAADNMNQAQQLAWSLMNQLATKARSHSGNYRSGLTNFIKAKANGTFPTINQALKAAAETIEDKQELFTPAAWFLVGEITAALGAASEANKAVQILERLSPANVWLSLIKNHQDQNAPKLATATAECILGVLAAQISYAPNTLEPVRKALTDDLSSRLIKCVIPTALIRASATVLFLTAPKNVQKVLGSLSDWLCTSEGNKEQTNSEKMRRCLAALGCLGELSVGTSNSKATHGRVEGLSDVVFARLGSLVQDETAEDDVKAQGILTIGQLCVADRASAFRAVGIVGSFLAESLNNKSSTLVKMAAVSVLTDWCIWHTSVAESYLDQMANCLRDVQPLMRRHALGAIGRLLDGNFIRWQDALFYRFVTTVIDEDPAIKTAACRYFETIVLPREKQFFLRKFIDTMVHFNGYVGAAKIGSALSQSQPASSQQSDITRKEKQLATIAVVLGLAGDSNRKRRFGIYRYMIDAMGSIEERLGLARRLIDNVLLAAVRDEIDVKGQISGEHVIKDACLILSDERLKFVKVLSNSAGVGDEDDEVAAADDENAEKRVEAKRAMLVQAVKHVVVKELLPAIVSTRAYMERVHPPLLGPVCDLLVSTYAAYKDELTAALSDDPELHRELEFHMRQANQRNRERQIFANLQRQGLAADDDAVSIAESEREQKHVVRELPDASVSDDIVSGEEDVGARRRSQRVTDSESENSEQMPPPKSGRHGKVAKSSRGKTVIHEEDEDEVEEQPALDQPEDEPAEEDGDDKEEQVRPSKHKSVRSSGRNAKKSNRRAAAASDD